MLVKEYRINLPLTVDEFRIGQLFCVAEAESKIAYGDVEVLQDAPFENISLLRGKYTKGQYTHKKIVKSDQNLPRDLQEIHQQSWDAFPYCKSIITTPEALKDAYFVGIESLYCQDRGEQVNVHRLPPKVLRSREVVVIDIAGEPVSQEETDQGLDPRTFRSRKTGRGPLGQGWEFRSNIPVMTCYKLVTVKSSHADHEKMEKAYHETVRLAFISFHRHVFCSMDRWCGKTIEYIRNFEELLRIQKDLDRKMLRTKNKVDTANENENETEK
jgi:hypothetical protein